MSQNIEIELNVSREIAEQFVEANRVIEKQIGFAPGASVLMALVLECEDMTQLANEYCEAFRAVVPQK